MATNALNTMFAVRPSQLVHVPPESPDTELLNAWNDRQTILAEIESKGRFYDSEQHSPGKTEQFDELTMLLIGKSAKTLQGVQVKLWTAMDYVGSGCWTDEKRDRSDTIRRADFREVRVFANELDVEQMALLQIISDVADLTATPVFGPVEL